MTKTVLCYGDSNTWGMRPDGSPQRYGHNVRWPRILQKKLGDDYYVIENGLNARTANLDDDGSDIRNGLHHLPVAVKSSAPLDIFIVMLGTNDLKVKFQRSAQSIAEGVAEVVKAARQYNVNYTATPLKVVVVMPIIPKQPNWWPDEFVENEAANNLCHELEKTARRLDSDFLDTSTFSEVGEDGVHLTAQCHAELAERIARMIEE